MVSAVVSRNFAHHYSVLAKKLRGRALIIAHSSLSLQKNLRK